MNLREETIKVLRPFAALIDTIECTTEHKIGEDSNWDINAPAEYSIVSIGDLLAARRLYLSLSRLEAGSGEETGIRLDEAARETLAKAIDCLDLEGFEETANGLHALINRADQEGGDAAGPPAETAAVNRRNVATPAPGENSERATIVKQLRDAVTASGGVDASAELLLTAATAIEVMARDWLADRKDNFAAGRRSMREEAAKVAHATKRVVTSDYSDGWADACERIERAIRAIPEKQ